MRTASLAAATFLGLVPPSHAALLKAIHPGVMCASAAALARLSAPDGSSRLDPVNPTQATLALARSGDCTDYPVGNVVILMTARHNTSIVRSDTLTGDGVMGTFLVANIDYRPYTVPHDPLMDRIARRCPSRLETVAVLGPPAGDFIRSLPPAERDAIDSAVDDICPGPTESCAAYAESTVLHRRHLEGPWADFICGSAR